MIFHLSAMGARSYESSLGKVNMDDEIIKLRKLFDKEAGSRARNAAHSLSDILMSGYDCGLKVIMGCKERKEA